MRVYFISFLFLTSLALHQTGVSQAQIKNAPLTPNGISNWNQINTPFDSDSTRYSEAVMCYFLNQNLGFVFQSQLSGFSNHPLLGLFRTTNGGASWAKIYSFDSTNCPIRQIYFVSPYHGYLACSTGIFETEDTGISWRKITSFNRAFNSVYASGNKVDAFLGGPVPVGVRGALISTEDDGRNWDTIIPPGNFMSFFFNHMTPYVSGNKENMVVAEKTDTVGNFYLVYSLDNGKNWYSNMIDTGNTGNWTTGFYCFPHCTDILRTRFLYHPDDMSSITYSANYGGNWSTFIPAIEIGAWIAGNSCALYVCNASVQQELGPLRSLDRGKTWQYVSGPDFTEIDDGDYRNLCIVGGGAIIYATDMRAHIWKSSDGGDGTLSSNTFASQLSIQRENSSLNIDTIQTTVCDTSRIMLYFKNLSCNTALFHDIKITGLDSTEYSTELNHHLACEDLPDTLIIFIFPMRSGIRDLHILADFFNDEFFVIDTNFVVTLITKPVSSKINLTFDLSPSNKDTLLGNACDSTIIHFFFQNMKCNIAVLQSLSITGLDSSEYSMQISQHLIGSYLPDSVLIKILPAHEGTRTLTIHALFKNGDSFIIDTTVNILFVTGSLTKSMIYLKSSNVIAMAKETIGIPLYINSVQTPTEPKLEKVDLIYSLNTDLISPLSFDPIPGVSADPVKNTKTNSTVTLHFDPDFTFTGETELGKLRCMCYVTDTLVSDIELTGMTNSVGCLNPLIVGNAVHVTLSGCGDESISKFIRSGGIPEFIIHPNPAENSISIESSVNLDAAQFEIFDQLGRAVVSRQSLVVSREKGAVVDVSSLANGMYYLRMDCNGFVRTKSLVINK
jgi:hypothetical protein